MSPKNISSEGQKKPFDKSQWRQNKYNHKNKVQKYEEKRRQSALHKYYKELRKSQQNVNAAKGARESLGPRGKSQKKRDVNPYEKAKQELEKRKMEKEKLREERAQQKAEREEALQRYRKDKIRKYVKLKQKTKKGQPVMAGRLELLLEKLQKSVAT